MSKIGGGNFGRPVRTRLFLPGAGAEFIDAGGRESMAVRRVLRLAEGDAVGAFNGDGMEYVYRVENGHFGAFPLRLEHSFKNPRDPRAPLTVLLAATKGKTKERMVKDLTALGAARIGFYEARRSVSRPERNLEDRLGKIAVEACRQCGRSTIPSVEVTGASLGGLPDDWFGTQTIVFWENETSPPPDRLTLESLTLIFGPEGGFADEETAWARERNFGFCGLGPRILRSELAAATGAALAQSRRGEM